jgi:thiol-disulfide isomerase/thioredoxin
MKIKAVIITIALIAASHVLLDSQGTLKWETDWQTVLKTAVEKKQPVLMDFYTDWCPHCKRLDQITFIDPKVIDYFKKENYALLKINPEKDIAAEKKFKVFSYPTLVIFKADGTEIDRMLGFKSPEDLIKSLEDLKKGIGTLEDLLSKYKKFAKDDKSAEKFDLMFGINDKYIARADYPLALEMIDEIIRLDKDNAKKKASAAMSQTGYIYYKWKKFKKAIEAMLAIHKAYPGSEEAERGYMSAAYYAEKIKDKETVLKVLKEFVKIFPDSKYVERCRKKIKKLEESQNK